LNHLYFRGIEHKKRLSFSVIAKAKRLSISSSKGGLKEENRLEK
jgi:hypothetical protein